MKKIILIMACIILLSCKKKEATNFSFQSCNIVANSNAKLLTDQPGTLIFTNKIGINELKTFIYIINITGQLPLEVCNMPTSVNLNENETKDVSFTGKMVILPNVTDAISTKIELIKLKFN